MTSRGLECDEERDRTRAFDRNVDNCVARDYSMDILATAVGAVIGGVITLLLKPPIINDLIYKFISAPVKVHALEGGGNPDYFPSPPKGSVCAVGPKDYLMDEITLMNKSDMPVHINNLDLCITPAKDSGCFKKALGMLTVDPLKANWVGCAICFETLMLEEREHRNITIAGGSGGALPSSKFRKAMLQSYGDSLTKERESGELWKDPAMRMRLVPDQSIIIPLKDLGGTRQFVLKQNEIRTIGIVVVPVFEEMNLDTTLRIALNYDYKGAGASYHVKWGWQPKPGDVVITKDGLIEQPRTFPNGIL